MQFIFLQEGVTASLIPINTLIEYKPENIVGCIILGYNELGKIPPDWFTDCYGENAAIDLLQQVKQGQVLGEVQVFLLVRESNSLLQLTVLACIDCCNFNCTGTGGSGGKRLLELLAKQNIPTYPAEVLVPDFSEGIEKFSDEYEQRYRQAMQDAFLEAFNVVASDWLPKTWGLEPVIY